MISHELQKIQWVSVKPYCKYIHYSSPLAMVNRPESSQGLPVDAPIDADLLLCSMKTLTLQ